MASSDSSEEDSSGSSSSSYRMKSPPLNCREDDSSGTSSSSCRMNSPPLNCSKDDSSGSSSSSSSSSSCSYRMKSPPLNCREDDSSGTSSSSSYRMNSPPSKKQRVIEETLVDRISELPDSLLIQILSLLRTRDAFTTSILSKRWLSLCTFVDSFSFMPRDFRKTVGSSSFVEYVLAHSVSPKIKKMNLDLNRDCDLDNPQFSYLHSLMSRCLSFAVERNIENVVIRFKFGHGCTLPRSFYTCSSLITLVFANVFFEFDGVIEWKSLKSLKLEHLDLSDDNIADFLAGCPALETIELFHVGGFHRLEISSLKLERLIFIGCHYERDVSLQIFSPNLQHLEISGDLDDLRYRLADVSSVVNAMLTFNVRCIKDILADENEDFDDEEDSCHDYHQAFGTLVQAYLVKLSNATHLIIGTWFADALCMLQLEGVSIPELKCKYLTLELHIQKFSLYGAAGLLQASPHVETLSIDMETGSSYEFPSHCCFGLRYLAKGDNIDLQSWISSFVFPKLKKVQIVISFSYDCDMDAFDKLFKLSEFLLKTAIVLEEFVIISKREMYMNCVPMSLFKLAAKLWSCQRSSPKSRIIFKEKIALCYEVKYRQIIQDARDELSP